MSKTNNKPLIFVNGVKNLIDDLKVHNFVKSNILFKENVLLNSQD